MDGREGVSDSTMRDPADSLVRVGWIGHHWRREKEKDGAISTASAVLVPFFVCRGSLYVPISMGDAVDLTWRMYCDYFQRGSYVRPQQDIHWLKLMFCRLVCRVEIIGSPDFGGP